MCSLLTGGRCLFYNIIHNTKGCLSFHSALNVSLVTARRCKTVAAPPRECTPLTQVVVDHSRCTAIWMVSGRSSGGEWMALSTSTATGPAMLMALMTWMVNTGSHQVHPAQNVPHWCAEVCHLQFLLCWQRCHQVSPQYVWPGQWHNLACHGRNLNGQYLSGAHTSYADGVNWKAFKGYHYSLKYAALKIRAVWGAVNNYKEV